MIDRPASLTQMPPLDEIARRIVECFHPQRIVVFGSRARGEPHPDSDLDLFVEMESELPPPRRSTAIAELFADRTWPLDVLVYTPAEAKLARGKRTSFLTEIEAQGRVLYERL